MRERERDYFVCVSFDEHNFPYAMRDCTSCKKEREREKERLSRESKVLTPRSQHHMFEASTHSLPGVGVLRAASASQLASSLHLGSPEKSR